MSFRPWQAFQERKCIMKNIDEKELNRLLEIDRKHTKQMAGRKEYNVRRNAYRQLMIEKATKAGITVSDKEVADYLKAV